MNGQTERPGSPKQQMSDVYNLMIGENFMIKHKYNELLHKYNELTKKHQALVTDYEKLSTSIDNSSDSNSGILSFLQGKNAELMGHIMSKNKEIASLQSSLSDFPEKAAPLKPTPHLMPYPYPHPNPHPMPKPHPKPKPTHPHPVPISVSHPMPPANKVLHPPHKVHVPPPPNPPTPMNPKGLPDHMHYTPIHPSSHSKDLDEVGEKCDSDDDDDASDRHLFGRYRYGRPWRYGYGYGYGYPYYGGYPYY